MTNPNDIRTLADWRYEEAENLSKIGYPDGAFYLAGYAVELCLKAKICETLGVTDFYSFHVPRADLSKTFLIHNLGRLILLSGLYAKFEAEKRTTPFSKAIGIGLILGQRKVVMMTKAHMTQQRQIYFLNQLKY